MYGPSSPFAPPSPGMTVAMSTAAKKSVYSTDRIYVNGREYSADLEDVFDTRDGSGPPKDFWSSPVRATPHSGRKGYTLAQLQASASKHTRGLPAAANVEDEPSFDVDPSLSFLHELGGEPRGGNDSRDDYRTTANTTKNRDRQSENNNSDVNATNLSPTATSYHEVAKLAESAPLVRVGSNAKLAGRLEASSPGLRGSASNRSIGSSGSRSGRKKPSWGAAAQAIRADVRMRSRYKPGIESVASGSRADSDTSSRARGRGSATAVRGSTRSNNTNNANTRPPPIHTVDEPSSPLEGSDMGGLSDTQRWEGTRGPHSPTHSATGSVNSSVVDETVLDIDESVITPGSTTRSPGRGGWSAANSAISAVIRMNKSAGYVPSPAKSEPDFNNRTYAGTPNTPSIHVTSPSARSEPRTPANQHWRNLRNASRASSRGSRR